VGAESPQSLTTPVEPDEPVVVELELDAVVEALPLLLLAELTLAVVEEVPDEPELPEVEADEFESVPEIELPLEPLDELVLVVDALETELFEVLVPDVVVLEEAVAEDSDEVVVAVVELPDEAATGVS
jgi:hypothetical protein